MCRSCLNSMRRRHLGMLPIALLGSLLSGCGSAATQWDAAGKSEDEQAGAAPAAAGLPPDAVQQFGRAVSLMGSRDLAQAEQGLRSLAAAYPAYSGPLLKWGILHTKAGKLDEAEK